MLLLPGLTRGHSAGLIPLRRITPKTDKGTDTKVSRWMKHVIPGLLSWVNLGVREGKNTLPALKATKD